MSVNKKYEKLFYPRVKKTIDKKFDETAHIVKSSGVQAAIADLNKDLTNPELAAEIRRLYASVGSRNANLTMRSLKQQERKGANFGRNEEWIAWILNYLKGHLLQKVLYTVNETTREHLLSVLYESVKNGLGIDETVRMIEEDMFSATQAERIVRTEVNIASNAGTLAAGQTYEYEMQKKWIAVHDMRTRGNNPEDHASHVALDGTAIDFNDVFIDPRNGDRLKSPGDPKASPESIINCRCQMSLKPKRDSRGRLIPKRKTTSVIYPNQNRPIRTITI